jgi:hypothetical protein
MINGVMAAFAAVPMCCQCPLIAAEQTVLSQAYHFGIADSSLSGW